jgi:hypothetical protein
MAIRNSVLQTLFFLSFCFVGKPEEATWKTLAQIGEGY